MGLIAAKCPQCGANIKVNNTSASGICEFCGTAFITEKAITNYNISTDNVVVNGEIVNNSNYNIESALDAVEKFIKNNLYDDAKMLIKQMTENYPYDYRGWWQMALLEYHTEGYWFDDNNNYKKALALADNTEIIKSYRDKEYAALWEENRDIVEFCKNPDLRMLDKIYISVGKTIDFHNHFSNAYLGLEVIDNKLHLVEYQIKMTKCSRYVKGTVYLKAEFASGHHNRAMVRGNIYDEYGKHIPELYISEIADSEVCLSQIPSEYYNVDYIDHIQAIKGDTLINLRSSYYKARIGCVLYLFLTTAITFSFIYLLTQLL